MSRARSVLTVISALAAALALAAVFFACSQTPTSVPIRTFERAQKVDVICLRVFGENAPEPLKQEECAPVPPNVNGGNLDNQLFALVTQTSRGEVAVVDLSAGVIIDQSQAVPGLNFLPVGANPTDITATPDGRMAFVASAEPNKFAIYGIPGHRILGDKAGRRDPEGAITLSSWPVCALPQRPGSLTVVPRRTLTLAPDGGAGDGGAETVVTELPYELVAVLPGDRMNSAKVITIDPRPFLRASPRLGADGQPLDDFGEGDVLAPGQLQACPITAAMELSGEEAVPDAFREGEEWDDGVKWVDGGVDLSCETPDRPARCGLRPCRCKDPTTGADAGDVINGADGGVIALPACDPDAGGDDEGALRALEFGPLDPPRPLAIARDDQMLYVADDGIPLIHVVDLSVPGAPRELAPFVVSSSVEPTKAVSVRALAVSPPTREYKRFLYAVDHKEGSIAVFDVTDPRSADRSPMRRPHAELNPFQPPDRIAFAAPVVAVAFARHDFPLTRIDGVSQPNAQTGLLCNPNPNVDPASGEGAADYGVFYRADSRNLDVGLGPARLRGVFAFATLLNGQIVAIDVDDWDAPCRRPQDLAASAATSEGISVSLPALAVAQPAPGPGDLDPYHAPFAPPESVSQEVFFPVSAPHRMRSNFLLRDDSRSGRHTPFLQSTPTITSTGAVTPPLVGPGSESTPKMRPTAARPGGAASGTEDVGVRFSFDTPDVHFDQEWTVTYEGKLPGFEGLPVTMSTTDGYASLVLTQPQGRFCARGVEDWAIGGERANAITNALAAAGRAPYPERLDRRMVDYVQVKDELLPANDAYWRQADVPEPNSCWDDRLNPANPADASQVEAAARARFEVCSNVFGRVDQESVSRDFPILEAYEDHLVVGRFVKFSDEASREVVYADPSNAAYLKLLRCCFHHQVRFDVRAASQWVTIGSGVGLLNHVTRGEGGRCVASCDPREALLNARAPSLPFGTPSFGAPDFAPFRDSPLAMRNPAFSFFIQNGQKSPEAQQAQTGLRTPDQPPVRDMTFRFQTRGQFQPLVINLAASTTAVNPQSMRFIESLGQIAVVDGASQGLVLIDLAGVTIARAPYF
ncbi:MAG: hypothetical protein KF782_05515 [Labilithrix sp.]|nr:hypothetical protein [Labilithrix sp.]